MSNSIKIGDEYLSNFSEYRSSFTITSMALSVQTIDRLSQPNLWHLTASSSGSARFLDAWMTGRADGVTVNIVDEGVNYRHDDLVGAYDTQRDYDPRDTDTWDSSPDTTSQRHGTQVAGLIAGSADNDFGTAGAALGATITSSYLRYGQLFDLNELSDIIAFQSQYDVSNNSWGFASAFSDNFNSTQFNGVETALKSVVEEGRDGLGTVMVFAAGNGKILTANGNIGDDSNFHNLQNSRFVIAVGAHDANGAPSYFSSPGTNVLLTAPGSGLLTTDGTEAGSQQSAFVSGTSFAAPLVSSTVALLLAENPNLGYRDIQEILVLSSISRTDSVENGAGHFNGGGLMFNREGGFGMLDAGAAVALARNWTSMSTFDNEQQLSFSFQPSTSCNPNLTVLQADLTNASGIDFSTDWVELSLTIFDTDLNDLRIELISPDGTRSIIAENMNAAGSRTYLSFTFSTAMTWGENPYGTWSLELSHATPTSNFDVYDATVHVYGDDDTRDDIYYYTDSFADLAANDPMRTHAVDTDGGTDTLNFAAARSSVSLDLSRETTSKFNGFDIHLDADFENAIGSSANDSLTGSNTANRLNGEAGDDVILGLDGDDTLLGGDGNDTLNGGDGNDTIDGGNGIDTVVFSSPWRDYAISYNSATATYSFERNGQIDRVVNVERFAFSDVTLHPSMLIHGANALTLLGSSGSENLRSTSADELLAGGGGADKFIIGHDSGIDTITDFSVNDKVVFQGMPHIRSYTDVMSRATQIGEDTVIDLGNGNSLTLQFTQKASLTTDNFITQHFMNPNQAITAFGASDISGGWSDNDRFPRVMADVNGDGKDDIVGFGDSFTFVSLATDRGFANTTIGIASFGASNTAGGWLSNEIQTRTLGDVNGDGMADIVGFGGAGTFVALALGNGQFANPVLAINSFGSDLQAGGWTNDTVAHREMADVNGDGCDDIVGFGGAGVYVALGNTNGMFSPAMLALQSFGSDANSGSWTDQGTTYREMADVNGDGRDDIVGFGSAGVYVALGNTDGTFSQPTLALHSFGSDTGAGGWTSQDNFTRHLGDINGDGYADIVGFGGRATYISFGNGDGTFGAPTADIQSFGYENSAGGWTSDDKFPRLLADVNGDGMAEIVGFAYNGAFVSDTAYGLFA